MISVFRVVKGFYLLHFRVEFKTENVKLRARNDRVHRYKIQGMNTENKKYTGKNEVAAMNGTIAISSCPKFAKDGIDFKIVSAGIENSRATVTINPPNPLLAKAFLKDIEEHNGTYNVQSVHAMWKKYEEIDK